MSMLWGAIGSITANALASCQHLAGDFLPSYFDYTPMYVHYTYFCYTHPSCCVHVTHAPCIFPPAPLLCFYIPRPQTKCLLCHCGTWT